MLHAYQKLEEIILAAWLTICTTAILVAGHGTFFRDSQAGPVISIRLDSAGMDVTSTHTALAPPGPGTGEQVEKMATAAMLTPSPSAANTPAPVPATPRRSPSELGLLQLDFNLGPSQSGPAAARSSRDGAIMVRKPLLAGGTALGSMDITIAGGSVLMLEAQQARRVLAGQPGKVPAALERLPDKGLVSFADLRALGIDLRYSPNEDVIRLNP